jgi:hypothetical protein
MRAGCLLRYERPGRVAVYLAAFPPIPKGAPQRREFERQLDHFAAVMQQDPTEKPSGYPTEISSATRRIFRQVPTEKPSGRRATPYYLLLRGKRG